MWRIVFRELDSKNKYGNQLTHVTQGSIEIYLNTIFRMSSNPQKIY